MGGVYSSQTSSSGECQNGLCVLRKFLGPSSRVPKALHDEATLGFVQSFGSPALVLAVAPGRAEVLGNHTDYNEGFILAAAIDRYVVIAGRRAPLERGSRCRLVSGLFPEAVVEFDVALQHQAYTRNKRTGSSSWANYLIGVAWELRRMGMRLGGFDAYVVSDVPLGAGVSSSAALEMATVKLLGHLFATKMGSLSQLDQIKVAKAAENDFVGMPCGILDQFSSGMGKAGSLIYLDCRSLDSSYVPISGVQFVLANTNAPHQLVDGKYKELREDCFAAKDVLVKASGKGHITHLRDVDEKLLEAHKHILSHGQRRRSSHIITENDRVQRGVEACQKGDMPLLGELMSKSHESSRDDFGNSCHELDTMQRLAQDIEGHLGSRLMGGGFGGSTINLIQDGYVESFVAELERRYEAETKIKPTILVCSTGDGAFCEALA